MYIHPGRFVAVSLKSCTGGPNICGFSSMELASRHPYRIFSLASSFYENFCAPALHNFTMQVCLCCTTKGVSNLNITVDARFIVLKS
jgi:hypothetical protein